MHNEHKHKHAQKSHLTEREKCIFPRGKLIPRLVAIDSYRTPQTAETQPHAVKYRI